MAVKLHEVAMQVVLFDSAVLTGLAVVAREAVDEKQLVDEKQSEAVDVLAVAAVSSFLLSFAMLAAVFSWPVVSPFLGGAEQAPGHRLLYS